MYWTSLLAIMALPAAIALPSFHTKRDYVATDATLYAYGTNISGLPILVNLNDGRLYIAQSNTTASGLASVNWDIPTLTTASTSETTASLSNGTSLGFMYTSTDNITLSDVMVVQSAPTSVNGTSTGFTLFGKQLVNYDGSSIASKFWAQKSASGDLWTLVWNSADQLQTEVTPVTLKTIAPSN